MAVYRASSRSSPTTATRSPARSPTAWALLDLYKGVIDGLELKDHLDHLRAMRDRIVDKQVELEIRMEDVLGQHQFAAERLAHCQKINGPDWRP